ncbi:MAG: DUF512 domain-containing protein [Lachnospiraceae bacterium]|nr:DUF512 domain-containing protein [Lachnospiraceae bacterium]
MKKDNKHIIKSVKPGSIAEELEIEAGDILISVNDQKINDIFDYQLLCEDEYVELLIRKPDGEEWVLEVEKDEDEDLGLEFESGLMDEYHSCRNKCIFCFIDQMPKGMRDTLYFKDDDSRLSFLQGNYITLTNMSDEDIDRIIRFNLAPINISVQTTNRELRCKMLHNRFAGDVLRYLDRLGDAQIEMNGQIVLCKGVNDGEELRRSIEDLSKYAPYMRSVSVVPAGITKYREGLYPLELFTPDEAGEVIDMIEEYQKKLYAKHGIHFIHASDEFYILAGREFPEEERYDGYLQIENGVGMMRSFINEANERLNELEGDDRALEISFFSGKLAYPTMKKVSESVMKKYPNIKIYGYELTNYFFGETITVTGLLTGHDIIDQLKDKKLGDVLLIPENTLRSGETVFLDDVTLAELENDLQINTIIVKSRGNNLVDMLVGIETKEGDKDMQPYELEDMNHHHEF